MSPPGRWYTCGQLVPQRRALAVHGWDGRPIGTVHDVSDGVQAVRHYFARMATGTPGTDADRSCGSPVQRSAAVWTPHPPGARPSSRRPAAETAKQLIVFGRDDLRVNA